MKEKILELLKEDIEKEGFEIVEIKSGRSGRRLLLQVFIDKKGGITLDDCERASGIIGFLLDGSDLNIPDYNLEVSSPGLDRPLVSENDFAKRAGDTVMINLSEPTEGIKNYIEGKIISAADNKVVVENKSGQKTIPIKKISNARIKIEI